MSIWGLFSKNDDDDDAADAKETETLDEQLAASRKARKDVLASIRTRTQEIRALELDTSEGEPVVDDEPTGSGKVLTFSPPPSQH